ncbi:hypothetical protein KIPB_011961 [Kipferlia bialata]|uniref:Uncharacterized protein n=1 Tax=Kipferlia bialata TaxID=797122 RepID=A0A9K3D6T2_9EUKA|nr:hypothetical protein KIPB_011961 [Kipferlia bialata]|eukprot:g11961.t1
MIPGIVFAFYIMWSPLLLLKNPDRGMLQSIRDSFSCTQTNLATSALLCLYMMALTILGALLLGVGTLFFIPVAYATFAVVFDRITGGSGKTELEDDEDLA